MAGYTKLFSTILASTIWREPADVRVVWITMLAMADAQGRVDGSVPGLADLARVTLEQCQAALKCLSEPDFFSRTKEFEGRRIKEMDGGWLILNYLKYRESDSTDLRREQNREAQKRWRHKHKLTVIKSNGSKPPSAQAEASAEAKAEALPNPKPAAHKAPERNVLLDAVAAIGGGDPMQTPKARWSALGKVLSDIRSATPEVTVDEIRRRERHYVLLYPTTRATPEALAKWWAQCDKRPATLNQNPAPTDADHEKGF